MEHLEEKNQEQIKNEIEMAIEIWSGYELFRKKFDRIEQARLYEENENKRQEALENIRELIRFYPQYKSLIKQLLAEHRQKLNRATESVENSYTADDFKLKKPPTKNEEEEQIIEAGIRRYDGSDAWK